MITTKQRSNLKALAHSLSPVVIIGKDGVSDEVKKSVNDVLEARELIKIRLLNNCSLTTKEVMVMLCGELSADPVQSIGSMIVIYRKSNKKGIEHIEF